MGRGVRRTRGVGADLAWHRAEDGSVGMERDELSDAGGGGAKPGADDAPRPSQFVVFVATRVLPLLTLTMRDGLGSVAVAASANAPVSSSVPKILVVDMIFTI